MAQKISGTHWLASATLVGVVYACSSTAEVTARPHGLTGGDAGSTGTGGSSNGKGGTGASSASGGSISIGAGGSSARGGKGGTSASGGAAGGGQSEAGVRNDFSAGRVARITVTFDP